MQIKLFFFVLPPHYIKVFCCKALGIYTERPKNDQYRASPLKVRLFT